MTPQETEPDLPVSVQESLAEAWADSGLLQGQGHQIAEQAQVLGKEAPITTMTQKEEQCPQKRLSQTYL